MKQRHQLLSQARIYLTQNPQHANLTTEELLEMVGQMLENQLMNRFKRYLAKIQGTKQYWYQRYRELEALIAQKEAPTFLTLTSTRTKQCNSFCSNKGCH